MFSVTKNTDLANNLIRWQLVSTQDSGHHQAMIQEYEHIQKPKTYVGHIPLLHYKDNKNLCKVYKGKISYKSLRI
jgi:hypothetical protein